MTEVLDKYSRFRDLLDIINDKLQKLSNETLFFETIETLKEDAHKLDKLKAEILESKKLIGDVPDLSTKQIQINFDNIIRIKKLEMMEIQTKITNLSNSKKLSTYKRD